MEEPQSLSITPGGDMKGEMEGDRPLTLDDAVEFSPTHHFRWEEPQQSHVLLYPEGIVKLNETAAAILRSCAAATSIRAGAAELSELYRRSDLDDDILDFLEMARAKGWIRLKP